jgi:hypothetical protein
MEHPSAIYCIGFILSGLVTTLKKIFISTKAFFSLLEKLILLT